MKKKGFTLSGLAITLFLATCFLLILSGKAWKKENAVVVWDVKAYYGYLPALFIHGDMKLGFIDENYAEHFDRYWPLKNDQGNYFFKMSGGLAYLYSPFFLIGHALATISDYKADGFSAPYKFMLQMSSLFYLCFGFIFLKKILKPHFKDAIIALTILAIGLGTNLFYFSTREGVLSHAYNFSLFACFIYLVIRWYEKSSIRRTIGLGILLGLISLIRPTNILILLFFLLYGIRSVHEIPSRIAFFLKKYPLVLLMILMVFLIWLPQFLYWKSVSGKYLFYSYRDEGFFFQNPQIIKGLFGYRNGWLLYTPMMVFAFLGLPLLYKKLRPFFAGILVFLIFNIWIVLSWWCWWYVGFGNRAFIESYALLAIPLAAFFTSLMKKKLFVKISFFALYIFFVFLNIFQSFQYINGAIHFDSMNKAAYWENFCKAKPTGKYWNLLTKPDYEKAVKGIYRTEQKE